MSRDRSVTGLYTRHSISTYILNQILEIYGSERYFSTEKKVYCLSSAWIVYQNSVDCMPHLCILHSTDMFKYSVVFKLPEAQYIQYWIDAPIIQF